MIQPGSKLAHYEVVSALGKGGMGEVWRARDTKLGREVAIKTLPDEFAQEADRLARFEREAKLLASLNHPNIASIHGFDEDNCTYFLVMELVEGDTLADRVGRGAIPVEESLKLALQISEALEAAHEKGVIHRDLKPANIKVTPDGKVKVLDFGLAKAFAGDEAEVNPANSPTLSMQATQQGMILGTAGYMSPEQARGEATDQRADVWAFGVVLFEMLSGRGTFEGRTVSDILAAVLAKDPDWNSLPLNLHPQLRRLLERTVAKDVKDRYHGIADTRVDIETVLADPAGVIVRPVEAVNQARPRSTGARIITAAGVILVIVATGILVWTLRPADPRPVVRWEFHLPDGLTFGNAAANVLAMSPTGEHFVYSGVEGFRLRSMDSLDDTQITDSGTGLFSPTLSPDGQSLAYFDFANNQLQWISIGGGAAVQIANTQIATSISWEADDTLLYAQEGDGVWQVSLNGGEPEKVIEIEPGEEVYGPRRLPGSDWILFALTNIDGAGRWNQADIFVESPTSGVRKLLVQGGSDARYVPTGHLVYAFQNVLYAVAFDLDRTEVTGAAVPVIDGIERAFNPRTNSGAAFYDFSADGTLVFVPGIQGAVGSGIAWVDAAGSRETIELPTGAYLYPSSPSDLAVAAEHRRADDRPVGSRFGG
jgi:serine/threonine-protein kinase